MNTQRHCIFFVLLFACCSQAWAVSCNYHDVNLGDSFSKVTSLCDEATEYVYSYTQKETITDDSEGRVKLSREQYDTDALVYYDLTNHLKITFSFRANELFDIVSERDLSSSSKTA